MGPPNIVIDTNVVVSAFAFGGKPWRVFERILNQEFRMLLHPRQLPEIKRVLSYEKLGFSQDEQQYLLDVILRLAYVVPETQKLFIIKNDLSDNMFLEIIQNHPVLCIVTGDQHLLKLKEYHETPIITPSKFLQYYGKLRGNYINRNN